MSNKKLSKHEDNCPPAETLRARKNSWRFLPENWKNPKVIELETSHELNRVVTVTSPEFSFYEEILGMDKVEWVLINFLFVLDTFNLKLQDMRPLRLKGKTASES